MSGEVLLVDDDQLIRTVVADELSDNGYSVHCAADERQAFAVLERHPGIAVAIVDYCIPRPTGIALCRQIADKHPNVTVALYTGHDELADARRGSDDLPILSKTLRIEQLVRAIGDLFEGRTPDVAEGDLKSRVEVLWRREAQRETARAVGRAMHSQFDRTMKEPLPDRLSDTVTRLAGAVAANQ